MMHFPTQFFSIIWEKFGRRFARSHRQKEDTGGTVPYMRFCFENTELQIQLVSIQHLPEPTEMM
jgi:hypothetical protein